MPFQQSLGNRNVDAPLHIVFHRREIKFPLGSDAWHGVVSTARRFLPVERFDGVHRVVNIRTTYLDTCRLDSYCEYAACNPIRTKIRIRRYGYDGRFDDTCWLEIKIKQYRYSLKRRFHCGIAELEELLAGRDIRRHVAEVNGGRHEAGETYRAARLLILERDLRPVVRVEYDRMSFQDGPSSGVRITVDRGIRFCNTSHSACSREEGIVLEIKQTNGNCGRLGEFRRTLALDRPSRFSKYARAIQALNVGQAPRRDSA